MNTDIKDFELLPVPPPTSPTVTSKIKNSNHGSSVRPTSTLSSVFYGNNANVWQTTIGGSHDKSDSLGTESSNAKNANQKPQERYVWEMCTRSHNVTPASTVLNSPDLNTDAVHPIGSQQIDQRHPHHQIKLGRSPVGKFEQNEVPLQTPSSPGSPTDIGKAGAQCLREGEIVVFDDIDTNWINKGNCIDEVTTTQVVPYDEDILKVTKMIGQLPIADYEGSPRRFGSNQSKQQIIQKENKYNAAIAKRVPGFPQRISPLSEEQRVAKELQELQNSVENPCNQAVKNESFRNVINDSENEIGHNRCNFLPPSAKNDSHEKKTATFEYLYEFSETRKVLEEFFKVTNADEEQRFSEFTETDEPGSCGPHFEFEDNAMVEQAYVGHRLARLPNKDFCSVHIPPQKQTCDVYNGLNDIELYIDSNSRSSEDLADTELEAHLRHHSRNFTLSPETTDYDSNCGDLDSLSNDVNCPLDFGKLYTSMPVLEDGLSSGHASDTENNIAAEESDNKYENNAEKLCSLEQQTRHYHQHQNIKQLQLELIGSSVNAGNEYHENCTGANEKSGEDNVISFLNTNTHKNLNQGFNLNQMDLVRSDSSCCNKTTVLVHNVINPLANELESETVCTSVKENSLASKCLSSPSSHALQHHHNSPRSKPEICNMQEAMNDLRSALQRAKTQPEKLKYCDEVLPAATDSPIWVPRKMAAPSPCGVMNHKEQYAGDEEEADTDLETDRLLGQQRLDEKDFFEEKTIWPKTGHIAGSNEASPSTSEAITHVGPTANNVISSINRSNKQQTFSSATIRQGIGTSLTPTSPEHFQIVGAADIALSSPEKLKYSKSPDGSVKSLKLSTNSDKKEKSRNKEGLLEPAVLIEGVLFRARYLGSTQLVCEGQPTKSTRMMQAEEAVSRIKALAPEGENQPSTEVDLFISTEKIMVLNTDLKEIMMDHALRTISYIADIGDLVVLMARRRFVPSDSSLLDSVDNSNVNNNLINSTSTNGCSVGATIGNNKLNRTPKMICHVFESDEAQFIAQSIGQAFQVAYMEFLKANGIEDHSFVKEMDYQEVLNSQEIFGDELEIFAKKELQKEVVVPKAKGEILGVVIVESGWGSMLPTVVIANLMSSGAAARCGQLNIGDQLIAINGLSLVGLPLSTCQSYIRNAKTQTAVKFTVVPCAPVVEVKIKRPNTKYQLGFSVQNGVICSLLRGGIAERGGVRVGHRIIEINNQSVVAVPHEKIVNLLATSVGEILMKTMPTSMFRLLTGQESPIFI